MPDLCGGYHLPLGIGGGSSQEKVSLFHSLHPLGYFDISF